MFDKVGKPPLEDLGKAIDNLMTQLRDQRLLTHSQFVLVSASLLENDLKKMLVAAMRPASKTYNARIFDQPGSPLNSLDGCILIAYSFRLIDEKLLKRLDVIKKIRNRFAHTMAAIDFDRTPELESLLLELGWTRDIRTPRLNWFVDLTVQTSREITKAGQALHDLKLGRK
jgi:hypothetical protein